VAGLCLAALPALPTGAEVGTTTDLLTFVRHLEAPDGYDAYEARIPIAPPKPLTSMTLAEVLAWQVRVRRSGAPSTAAGGYQIIYPTLQRLVRKYGIDRDARFDAGMQDRLARLLIAECGDRPALAATAAHSRYGNCLAGIWAALPLTAGRNRGRSAYHGVAGNRALTSPRIVLALLAGEPAPLRRGAGSARPDTVTEPPLAFGAVRVRMSDIDAAMRSAADTGGLTPSVHEWEFDPYASQ